MKQSFAEQCQQGERDMHEQSEVIQSLKKNMLELSEDNKNLKEEVSVLTQLAESRNDLLVSAEKKLADLEKDAISFKKDVNVYKELAEYRKDLLASAEKKLIDLEKDVINYKERIRFLEAENDNSTQQLQKAKKANKIRKGPVLDECNEYANMTFEAGDEITQLTRSRKKIAPGSRKRTLNESITLSGKKRRLENTDCHAELSPVDNTRLTRARARKKLAF